MSHNPTLLIRTITTAGILASSDRIGWIRMTGITVPSGGTSLPVFQDAPGDTILQSITVSALTFDVAVEASYPLVTVGTTSATLAKVGSIYSGTVSVTIATSASVVATVINPDGTNAATDSVNVTVDTPPVLLTLSFVGGYPGSQTELKAGDTYQLTGTLDKAADAIEVQDLAASDAVQLLAFASATTFTVTMVVGDRGTTVLALAATARARAATTGAFGATRATDLAGGTVDGTDLINLNNLFPSVVIGAIVYPATQGALKLVEVATVANTVSDFDVIAYDSPVAELTISNPATSEDPKTVTRLAGTYNVTVNNFRITATRNANAAVTVAQTIVAIADTAAALAVTEPAARLRSGGNDGTAVQDHTITITSDQDLPSVPTLAANGGGARGSFGAAFVGGPLVFTSDMQVADADEKGVFAWGAISATNLAGVVTSVIAGDANYELGGFVARTLTFASFATTVAMNVEVVDFAKLTAGIFTSTNQTALKQAISTPPSVTDGFTIDAVGINPTSAIWLDTPAASANSSGTAQITLIEETV